MVLGCHQSTKKQCQFNVWHKFNNSKIKTNSIFYRLGLLCVGLSLSLLLFAFYFSIFFHLFVWYYWFVCLFNEKKTQEKKEIHIVCLVYTTDISIYFMHLSTELKAVVLGTADLYVKTGSDIILTCKISKGPHELGTVFWYKGKPFVWCTHPKYQQSTISQNINN